ncbi:hypothetical protein TEA_024263 [Camellia sinensis var. sinensis]|uniref:MATH domain-containing protein n=1 Tax=Camellia sinensis var. sinensis TaxID=542762 RepID=A0A4S4D9C1_CAMSN|nr:hypothetical protein TEA_024263 [Camellia sinensis var. sinensis]
MWSHWTTNVVVFNGTEVNWDDLVELIKVRTAIWVKSKIEWVASLLKISFLESILADCSVDLGMKFSSKSDAETENMDHNSWHAIPLDYGNSDINGKVRRFHGMKREWGFAQLLPLSTFNDAANGYLIRDTCVFGAEVFVINYTGRGECLTLGKELDNTHTWKIDNFSSLDGKIHFSDVFTIGNHKWKLWLYPKGDSLEKDKWLSLYLVLDNWNTFPSERKTYSKFSLRIRNQYNDQHVEFTASNCFSASNFAGGVSSFLSLTDLHDASMGFLVNDTLIVQAKVIVTSTVKNFSEKLSLYPNGDKERKGGHISLYLVIAETSNLPLGWEVNVSFKLFVYDQIQDKYVTIQDADGKVRHFHGMKTGWRNSTLISSLLKVAIDGYWFTASETSYGFPSFSLLTDLRKTSKGFLINDTLIVQVEVTVMSTVKNFAL